VNGPGAAIDDWEITGPANTSLPLTLTGFTAFKNNADVMVKWNTSNEQNVSRFIIERSSDGINFAPIGSVAARNQPQDTYSYPDLISQMPVRPSGYLHYRLKMVDADEHFRYSNIARISIEADANLVVGPNPFRDQLNIYAQAEIKTVTLTDMGGREVFRSSGVVGNRITIPGKLPSGQYLLRIQTVNGVITKKVYRE
jgi:hypothetical protein